MSTPTKPEHFYFHTATPGSPARSTPRTPSVVKPSSSESPLPQPSVAPVSASEPLSSVTSSSTRAQATSTAGPQHTNQTSTIQGATSNFVRSTISASMGASVDVPLSPATPAGATRFTPETGGVRQPKPLGTPSSRPGSSGVFQMNGGSPGSPSKHAGIPKTERESYVTTMLDQAGIDVPASTPHEYGPFYRMLRNSREPIFSNNSASPLLFPDAVSIPTLETSPDSPALPVRQILPPAGSSSQQFASCAAMDPLAFFSSSRPASAAATASVSPKAVVVAHPTAAEASSPAPGTSPKPKLMDPVSDVYGTPLIKENLRNSPVKTKPSFVFGPSL